MKTVYDFLKICETYYLGTIDCGNPRVRPFGTIDIFEDKLYIQTGKKKNVYRQIIQNPNIEICAFNGGKWLRINCELVEDDRVEAKKHMLDEYPSLRNMYDENDDNTIVFYMKNVTAVFSSFIEDDEIIKF